jgi:hypothetical protein
MTMRDLFKDESNTQYAEENSEQPLLNAGDAENPEEEGAFDDGMSVMPNTEAGGITHDFRYIDRFVRVKGMPSPAKNTNEESNFILGNEFSEQLVLNFLSDADQRKIWRSLADVMDLSEGSGNAKVALTDAKLLASRILMKRSSTENELALNERSAHIEQRMRSNITTKNNVQQRSSDGGWLSRLFGK